MTVGDKLNMTLSMLKTAEGNIQSFSMDTKDPSAQKMFTDMSNKLNQICQDLQSRISYVEKEEPQYKAENMQQKQQDNMQQQ